MVDVARLHAVDMAKRPRLDEFVAATKERRAALRQFEIGCNAAATLECDDKKLSELPGSVVTTWWMSKYGVELVGKVCRCESSLPQAITEAQRLEFMSQQCGLEKNELKPLREFILNTTPMLLEVFSRGIRDGGH